MERTTKNRLRITPETKPSDLKEFLAQANPNARLRFKNGELYCREERKGSALTRAKNHLSGDTAEKRQKLRAEIEKVFDQNKIDFNSHVKKVLLPHELEKLDATSGDLKVKHLMRVFTGTLKVDGNDYQYDRFAKPFAHGAYGDIYRAKDSKPTGETRELALKQIKKLTAEQENALRQEVATHLKARHAQVDKLNYVVETSGLVKGQDGEIYLPMPMALCSGEKLFGQFTAPAAANEVNSLVLVSVHDWLMGLYQLHSVRWDGSKSIGMAHRDIKPENWLLSQEGVWQLSDFGTAGDSERIYPAHQIKGHRVTGNGTVMTKAPEWLHSELAPDRENPDKFKDEPPVFRVGHKADVYSLGAAVFRLLNNGQWPFNNPSAPATTEVVYEEQVLAYRESGKPYCQWYFEEYGQEIPAPWRHFFDRALHSDPDKRATAGELLELPIFGYLKQMDIPKLRADLVLKAQSVKGAT